MSNDIDCIDCGLPFNGRFSHAECYTVFPNAATCDICEAEGFPTVHGTHCFMHAPRCAGCDEVLHQDVDGRLNGILRDSEEYAEVVRNDVHVLVHAGCMFAGEEIA